MYCKELETWFRPTMSGPTPQQCKVDVQKSEDNLSEDDLRRRARHRSYLYALSRLGCRENADAFWKAYVGEGLSAIVSYKLEPERTVCGPDFIIGIIQDTPPTEWIFKTHFLRWIKLKGFETAQEADDALKALGVPDGQYPRSSESIF